MPIPTSMRMSITTMITRKDHRRRRITPICTNTMDWPTSTPMHPTCITVTAITKNDLNYNTPPFIHN